MSPSDKFRDPLNEVKKKKKVSSRLKQGYKITKHNNNKWSHVQGQMGV
jgi:hypothetical protein